jgi:hypothetical protein
MLLLIDGHFHIELSVGHFELRKQGDYAAWAPESTTSGVRSGTLAS